MGNTIFRNGITPMPDKVAAINATRPPENASEVPSFLRLVNFCSKFLPDLAAVTVSLRQCTRASGLLSGAVNRLNPSKIQELKHMMRQRPSLAIFDRAADATIIADASPVGLREVLIQEQEETPRIIGYASRPYLVWRSGSLTPKR